MLNDVIKACQELLRSPVGAAGESYLDERLSRVYQDKFQFGYFPENTNLYSLFSFIDEISLSDNNLLYIKTDYSSNKEYFYSPMEEHNLIMPYKDVLGRVIALVGRTLLTEESRKEKELAKYKNTSFEKSKHLFGLYEAKRSILDKNYVYLVEGQFDCIQAHAAGIENIVAVGSSSLSFEQFALLLRYTNRIHLLFDNDEAGDNGRENAKSKFGQYASFIDKRVPVGFKDLDEYLRQISSDIKSDEIERSL